MSSLNKQVGGTHYKDMGVQPLEACYLNYGYIGLEAAVYTKVLKYLGRDKKSKVQDIGKAIHCLEILREKAQQEIVVLTTSPPRAAFKAGGWKSVKGIPYA